MTKTMFARAALAAAAVSGMFGARAALAEPYVDYVPQKGVWHVTTVKVDPNHIDDYLVGLRKEWAPGEEVAKRHGVIDRYQILVKVNAADGQGNLLLVEHIPSLAMLEADKARDQAMERDVYAAVPKAEQDASVKDFDKYRTFVGDDYYTDMVFVP